jgi:hypothetical protein
MCPTAGGAAAKHQAEPRRAALTRDERLYGRIRGQKGTLNTSDGRSKWCK